MKRIVMGNLCVFLLASCSDDPAPKPSSTNNSTSNQTTNSSNNTTNNTTNNATNNATNNTNNATNNQTTCDPQTACAADICGVVDDGCGGTVDCGECPCTHGVASAAGCGACELGVTVCGTDETGQGVCELPLQGITALTCEDMVFVNGSGGGEGTKENPMSDIAAAITQAKANDRKLIVIGGSSTISTVGPLELAEGIHIIGGFDETFASSPLEKPVILNTSVGTSHIFAAQATALVETTHVKNVEFRTGDAAIAGANTYGLWANQAAGLVLTNVTFAPGKPGAGANGVGGTNIVNGQNGLPGLPGNYRTNQGQPFPLRTATVVGGLGCEGAPQGGGIGGQGAGYSAPTNPTQLRSATAGTRTYDGQGVGGAAGENYGFLISPGTSGGAGQGGTVGTTVGLNGGRGTGKGMMDATLFFVRSANGSGGGIGDHGTGGAGGGGAGANDGDTGGPSGGSGGGGACGGEGGTGGTQGGSSFGLVLQDSEGLTYSGLVLTPAAGAVGGAGGAGGPGSAGGLGGQGGDDLIAPNATKSSTLMGGDGGDGGAGARGGHGGGGAGGHSIALWCDRTTDFADLTLTPSTAGVGGTSLGLAGEVGLSLQQDGCDL